MPYTKRLFYESVYSVHTRNMKPSLLGTGLASLGSMKNIRLLIYWYGPSNLVSKSLVIICKHHFIAVTGLTPFMTHVYWDNKG